MSPSASRCAVVCLSQLLTVANGAGKSHRRCVVCAVCSDASAIESIQTRLTSRRPKLPQLYDLPSSRLLGGSSLTMHAISPSRLRMVSLGRPHNSVPARESREIRNPSAYRQMAASTDARAARPETAGAVLTMNMPDLSIVAVFTSCSTRFAPTEASTAPSTSQM